MAANTITMDQMKSLINFYIDRNIELQEAGEMPIAIGFEAEAGIGR